MRVPTLTLLEPSCNCEQGQILDINWCTRVANSNLGQFAVVLRLDIHLGFVGLNLE